MLCGASANDNVVRSDHTLEFIKLFESDLYLIS